MFKDYRSMLNWLCGKDLWKCNCGANVMRHRRCPICGKFEHETFKLAKEKLKKITIQNTIKQHGEKE